MQFFFYIIKIIPRSAQGSHKCFCRLETFVDS